MGRIDCKLVFSYTDDGIEKFVSTMVFEDTGYNGMHDLEKALCGALLGLGVPARDPTPAAA